MKKTLLLFYLITFAYNGYAEKPPLPEKFLPKKKREDKNQQEEMIEDKI